MTLNLLPVQLLHSYQHTAWVLLAVPLLSSCVTCKNNWPFNTAVAEIVQLCVLLFCFFFLSLSAFCGPFIDLTPPVSMSVSEGSRCLWIWWSSHVAVAQRCSGTNRTLSFGFSPITHTATFYHVMLLHVNYRRYVDVQEDRSFHNEAYLHAWCMCSFVSS